MFARSCDDPVGGAQFQVEIGIAARSVRCFSPLVSAFGHGGPYDIGILHDASGGHLMPP
jgi:hypothetical protein